MVFEFKIDGLPVSVNRVWRTGQGRTYKSEEYKTYEYNVENAIRGAGYGIELLRSMTGRPFKLEIELHRPSWLAKNGNLKKPDLTNCIKSAEDAVCKFCDWDDVFNFHTEVSKIDGGLSEFHVVRFYFFDVYSTPNQ